MPYMCSKGRSGANIPSKGFQSWHDTLLMKIIDVNIDKQLQWAFGFGLGIGLGGGVLWLLSLVPCLL